MSVIESHRLEHSEKSGRGALSAPMSQAGVSRLTKLDSQKDLWNHLVNLLALQPRKAALMLSHLLKVREPSTSHAKNRIQVFSFPVDALAFAIPRHSTEGSRSQGEEFGGWEVGFWLCHILNSAFLLVQTRKARLQLPSVTQESQSRVFISRTTYWKRLVSLEHINPRSKHKNKRTFTQWLEKIWG